MDCQLPSPFAEAYNRNYMFLNNYLLCGKLGHRE